MSVIKHYYLVYTIASSSMFTVQYVSIYHISLSFIVAGHLGRAIRIAVDAV